MKIIPTEMKKSIVKPIGVLSITFYENKNYTYKLLLTHYCKFINSNNLFYIIVQKPIYKTCNKSFNFF